jgi:hypothetical protein
MTLPPQNEFLSELFQELVEIVTRGREFNPQELKPTFILQHLRHD